MINEEETLQLQTALESLPQAIEVILYKTEDSEFGRQLVSFVYAICGISKGKLKVLEGTPEAASPASPCFRISKGEQGNVTYAVVPLGHQLAPFLQALRMAAERYSLPFESSLKHDQIGSPAEIWVLVSSECPRCPKAVEAAVALSYQHPLVSLFIIDALQFPALAQERGIKAVPATVIDQQLALVGNISASRLEELVRIRGTEKYSEELIRSYIETRRIGKGVDMLQHGDGRPAILSLMQEPDLSTRMGALLVLEETLDSYPTAIREMVPSLIGLLSHQDARIRGDVADFLGRAGDPQAIPSLEDLTNDEDADVAEASAEALELLRQQGNL